jgi:hypothetical protein
LVGYSSTGAHSLGGVQVSVWVPIVVGVIGVIGVVVGQSINAWQDRRRRLQERERDEIRWRRERQQAWKDIRLQAYASLLKSLDVAISFLSSAQKATSSVQLHRMLEELETKVSLIEQAAAEVELIGDDGVRDITERLRREGTPIFGEPVDEEFVDNPEEAKAEAARAEARQLEAERRQVTELGDAYEAVREALVRTMRLSLGVVDGPVDGD